VRLNKHLEHPDGAGRVPARLQDGAGGGSSRSGWDRASVRVPVLSGRGQCCTTTPS
jgi:hypothetical protein